MLEQVLEYERGLFLLLNGSNYPFLDRFMWLYSGKAVWLPLVAFILFTLLYKKPWRESLLILVAIAVVITLCDQFASHLCKPLFARFRPTHHPDFMDEVKTVFGYRGGRYGFMSSHAANAFGFAVFMVRLFRCRIFTLAVLLWATLTAYSRVYLGVHFISDVVAGALAGVVFGYGVYSFYAWVREKYFTGANKWPAALYSVKEKQSLAWAITATTLIVLALNYPLASLLH
ncbi:phosphatase PAP2 family protein [Bacteroidia bacterium]|nr:phosphatase PAP2 family protein [Bacteroidia bacterium]